MRPIKFRAWFIANKTWIPSTLFSIEANGDITIDDGQGYPIKASPKAVVIMQFTGLHDKNGKEIFEGDIIKPKPFTENQSAPLQTVCWNSELACFMCYGTGWSLDWYEVCKYGEVLGNINENGDLLK